MVGGRHGYRDNLRRIYFIRTWNDCILSLRRSLTMIIYIAGSSHVIEL